MILWNHKSILSIKGRRNEIKCVEHEMHRRSGYIMSDHNKIQTTQNKPKPNKHDIEKKNNQKESTGW